VILNIIRLTEEELFNTRKISGFMRVTQSFVNIKALKIINSLIKDRNIQEKWLLTYNNLKMQANVIKKLEKELPEAWVPLRIACSALLTQRTHLKSTRIPQSLSDWKKIWIELKPIVSKKGNTAMKFTLWLKSRGNHRYAKKYGEYFEAYCQTRGWNLKNTLKDLHNLRSLKSAEEVKKWWMQFKGIGVQYAKNIPMDEMDKRFIDFVKIDYRLSKLIDEMGGSNLKANEKQNLFVSLAKNLNMSSWEVDRFCFNFYKDIISKLNQVEI
jgi:hypothetical protein